MFELEAIPLTTRKGRGCYMILILYCSGDPEWMGRVLRLGRKEEEEEEEEGYGVISLFNT